MVEFILGTFIVVLIRNRIVSNINKKAGVELYPVYNLKPIFRHWSIFPPLVMMLCYIALEICVFQRNYWFIPYQQPFKTITLLSYLPLIFKYRLYESAWTRLKQKHDFINIITSPMGIGAVCLFLCSLLNHIAISANNGMPIFPSLTLWTGYMDKQLFDDGLHILGNFNTKHIWACDIFDVGYSIMSIGDIFTRLYVSIVLYFSIKNNSIYSQNNY